MNYRLVMTTCPDQATADRLADSLVQANLAACVSCLPGVQSVYRWKGEVMREQEFLLLIKTRADHYSALEQTIKNQHPYECPEIIAVPVVEGFKPYLDWIDLQLENQ